MVRNLDHSGRCGPMTVIYSGDIDLLRDNLQAMFHGAKLDDRTGWRPRNITQRIMALLDGLSDDVVEVTADGVAAALDAGPWKGISKLVPSDADLSYVAEVTENIYLFIGRNCARRTKLSLYIVGRGGSVAALSHWSSA
jgi:hypothetical protein